MWLLFLETMELVEVDGEKPDWQKYGLTPQPNPDDADSTNPVFLVSEIRVKRKDFKPSEPIEVGDIWDAYFPWEEDEGKDDSVRRAQVHPCFVSKIHDDSDDISIIAIKITSSRAMRNTRRRSIMRSKRAVDFSTGIDFPAAILQGYTDFIFHKYATVRVAYMARMKVPDFIRKRGVLSQKGVKELSRMVKRVHPNGIDIEKEWRKTHHVKRK